MLFLKKMFALTIICSLVLLGQAFATEPITAYPIKGEVVNELHMFDNPEAVIFSLDGQYLFVANTAVHANPDKPFGFTEGAGSISKLEIGSYGDAKIVDLHFIDKITSPLGMAVLPVNTRHFTRGTIFSPVGNAPLSDADGNPITDPNRLKTKIMAFNPDSGEIVGTINLAHNSIFESISGGPVVLCNALAFDDKGNLFLTDTGFGADQFEPKIPYNGGTWMIPIEILDELSEGKSPSTNPLFVPNPGWPDGVEVSPLTGNVWVNSVGDKALDPAYGGIWELTIDDFKAGKEVAPVFSQLGRLDGLDFSSNGIQFNTEIKETSSVVVIQPDGQPKILQLEPEVSLSGPADLVVKTLEDGSMLLVIPELSAFDATPWNDDVTIVRLPPGFAYPDR